MIACVLNLNGPTTGNGNRWTRERVTALRSYRKIPVFHPQIDRVEPWLNLGGAAKLLGITQKTLRLAAEIEGTHPLYPMAHGYLAVQSSLPHKHVRSLIASGSPPTPHRITGSQDHRITSRSGKFIPFNYIEDGRYETGL